VAGSLAVDYLIAMTIVTAAPKRRRPKQKQARPLLLQQTIVTARKPGRSARPEPEIDPEAEARVRAFFARAIRPPSD
jgi:hypothetical protein